MDLFFGASKLVASLLLPGNLLVLLALCSVALVLFQRTRRIGLRVGMAATGLLVAAALLPVGPLLLQSLERRFAPFGACEGDAAIEVTGIILLGGGMGSSRISGEIVDDLNDASDRIRLAASLAKQFPEVPVLVSGGEAFDNGFDRPEAKATRALLVELGVPEARIVLEQASRTTAENAARSAPTMAAGQWLLVTSAFHMPRAVGTFRKAGVSVIAAPTDWRVPDTPLAGPFDALHNLGQLNLATKEYLGLFGYWATGRSSELLPAPPLSNATCIAAGFRSP